MTFLVLADRVLSSPSPTADLSIKLYLLVHDPLATHQVGLNHSTCPHGPKSEAQALCLPQGAAPPPHTVQALACLGLCEALLPLCSPIPSVCPTCCLSFDTCLVSTEGDDLTDVSLRVRPSRKLRETAEKFMSALYKLASQEQHHT